MPWHWFPVTPFHKPFMNSWLKSCKKYFSVIQILMIQSEAYLHNSSAAVVCSNLCHDLIIIFRVSAKHIPTKLWGLQTICEMVSDRLHGLILLIWVTLIPAWISNYRCGIDYFFIQHSGRSLGISCCGWVISSHILQGIQLLTHVLGLNLVNVSKRAPREADDCQITVINASSGKKCRQSVGHLLLFFGE